jgi:hypothetical protein
MTASRWEAGSAATVPEARPIAAVVPSAIAEAAAEIAVAAAIVVVVEAAIEPDPASVLIQRNSLI